MNNFNVNFVEKLKTEASQQMSTAAGTFHTNLVHYVNKPDERSSNRATNKRRMY